MKYNCETCKDTKEYCGLNTVEPCRDCCGRPVEIGSTESLMASLAKTGCLTPEERQKIKKYCEDHKCRVATKPIVLEGEPFSFKSVPADLDAIFKSPNPDLVFNPESEEG